MPTVPDFIRSTPPASLHAYFMSIKAVLPADVVWEGAANEVVPPLLRAVDAMDDAERLRVMNDADRVMARNISAATFDLAAATLSVGVVKRRVP